MSADGDRSQARLDFSAVVSAAKRGLRRDVAALEAALDDADLLVPLARNIEDAPEGQPIPLDREVTMIPHFVSDEEGGRHVALFTRTELASRTAERLGWTTEGGELSVCSLPARLACQLALELVDEISVLALVIDPGHESELVLRRAEVASIVAGQALPLVGYISDLPPLEDERLLVAEPSDPPPPELTEALERCLAQLPEVSGYGLSRTFNAERDLEPHLTLSLTTLDGADRRGVAERVIDAVRDKLPPPGYIDIVFDDG